MESDLMSDSWPESSMGSAMAWRISMAHMEVVVQDVYDGLVGSSTPMERSDSGGTSKARSWVVTLRGMVTGLSCNKRWQR